MQFKRTIEIVGLLCMLVTIVSLGTVTAQESSDDLDAALLVSELEGGSGSTIGPDGALYVTENLAGRISRVDPQTGEVTTFASNLPQMNEEIGIGGTIDVAFIGDTAYVLTTLVGEDVGGDDIVGIYRIDGPDSVTVMADIGEYSIDNPSDSLVEVPSGVQYAMEVFQEGFLVTDGHHNRVLYVTVDGDITELIASDNTVQTGLEVSASSNTIYIAEAGPLPHMPETGKVLALEWGSSTATEIASGARLLVDVEYGCCGTLYALAQGAYEGGVAGSPAQANTGSLVRVNRDATFTVLVDGLNQPTSFEVIEDTAYVVTLGGEIWTIDGISG